MAVQTRTYADFGFNFERDRARLTREGDMVIVNVTSSYAPVITLTVEVADATGAPAAGVDVDLSIMNAGGWRDIARLVTDEDGARGDRGGRRVAPRLRAHGHGRGRHDHRHRCRARGAPAARGV